MALIPMQSGFLDDRILDLGLNILSTEATHLYLCNAAPTTFTEASSTFALGNKAAPTISTPGAYDNPPDGRQVTVSQITDGTGTSTGTATHIAVTDNGNSRLLAVQALASSFGVTNGQNWPLTSFQIILPGAAT